VDVASQPAASHCELDTLIVELARVDHEHVGFGSVEG
jgi:hypothetical protein